jgi:hypothetical protein
LPAWPTVGSYVDDVAAGVAGAPAGGAEVWAAAVPDAASIKARAAAPVLRKKFIVSLSLCRLSGIRGE